MTYVKTYLPTLKTHVVNLKRDAKDLSRDLQRLEVRGELGSKTLYCLIISYSIRHVTRQKCNIDRRIFKFTGSALIILYLLLY